MSLIGGRARTVFNTAPAPVPDEHAAAVAAAGKVKLDSLVTRAERTVAASQRMFAENAARELRG